MLKTHIQGMSQTQTYSPRSPPPHFLGQDRAGQNTKAMGPVSLDNTTMFGLVFELALCSIKQNSCCHLWTDDAEHMHLQFLVWITQGWIIVVFYLFLSDQHSLEKMLKFRLAKQLICLFVQCLLGFSWLPAPACPVLHRLWLRACLCPRTEDAGNYLSPEMRQGLELLPHSRKHLPA